MCFSNRRHEVYLQRNTTAKSKGSLAKAKHFAIGKRWVTINFYSKSEKKWELHKDGKQLALTIELKAAINILPWQYATTHLGSLSTPAAAIIVIISVLSLELPSIIERICILSLILRRKNLQHRQGSKIFRISLRHPFEAWNRAKATGQHPRAQEFLNRNFAYKSYKKQSAISGWEQGIKSVHKYVGPT